MPLEIWIVEDNLHSAGRSKTGLEAGGAVP